MKPPRATASQSSPDRQAQQRRQSYTTSSVRPHIASIAAAIVVVILQRGHAETHSRIRGRCSQSRPPPPRRVQGGQGGPHQRGQISKVINRRSRVRMAVKSVTCSSPLDRRQGHPKGSLADVTPEAAADAGQGLSRREASRQRCRRAELASATSRCPSLRQQVAKQAEHASVTKDSEVVNHHGSARSSPISADIAGRRRCLADGASASSASAIAMTTGTQRRRALVRASSALWGRWHGDGVADAERGDGGRPWQARFATGVAVDRMAGMLAAPTSRNWAALGLVIAGDAAACSRPDEVGRPASRRRSMPSVGRLRAP